MHRSPANFSPHSTRFLPERWLISPSSTDAEEAAKTLGGGPFVHNEGAFIPFSYGPFNCVGKQLALHEIRVVVVALLQRFRVRRAREDVSVEEWWDDYEREYKDFFVSVRGRVRVVLEERARGD